MSHVLKIHDTSGDTEVAWKLDDKASIDKAIAAFEEQVGNGSLAYKVDPKDASKGEVIKSFDPDAELIRITNQLQGG